MSEEQKTCSPRMSQWVRNLEFDFSCVLRVVSQNGPESFCKPCHQTVIRPYLSYTRPSQGCILFQNASPNVHLQ